MNEHTLEHTKQIFSYIFQILLFVFLILLLLQQFYPLEVNSRINLNGFMLVVIIFGAVAILFPAHRAPEFRVERITKKDVLLIIFLGILGAAIIYLKLKTLDLSWLSIVISVLGGLIIVLLSWLLLKEEDN